jgi:hypothetical protein
MDRQITLSSQVPGCTLQVVHSGKASFVAPWSISVYARVTTAADASALQLVYAPADELVLRFSQCTGYTVSARYNSQISSIFEISHDAAAAIAEFAGVAMPAQLEAA